MGLTEISSEIIFNSMFFTLAGLVVHILKKSVNQAISPLDYLKLYKGRTAAAMSAVVTGYLTLLITDPHAGGAAYFAIGYVLDSVLNKAPSREEVELGEGVKMRVMY